MTGINDRYTERWSERPCRMDKQPADWQHGWTLFNKAVGQTDGLALSQIYWWSWHCGCRKRSVGERRRTLSYPSSAFPTELHSVWIIDPVVWTLLITSRVSSLRCGCWEWTMDGWPHQSAPSLMAWANLADFEFHQASHRAGCSWSHSNQLEKLEKSSKYMLRQVA